MKKALNRPRNADPANPKQIGAMQSRPASQLWRVDLCVSFLPASFLWPWLDRWRWLRRSATATTAANTNVGKSTTTATATTMASTRTGTSTKIATTATTTANTRAGIIPTILLTATGITTKLASAPAAPILTAGTATYAKSLSLAALTIAPGVSFFTTIPPGSSRPTISITAAIGSGIAIASTFTTTITIPAGICSSTPAWAATSTSNILACTREAISQSIGNQLFRLDGRAE